MIRLLFVTIFLLFTSVSAQAAQGCGQTATSCWTTATRPAGPGAGTFGYNTTTNLTEWYNGTNWQSSASVLNVTAFGATGDGSTNDTTAIQAALTAANTAGGGLVIFPCGTFLVTATLNVFSNTLVAGSGWCTIIMHHSTTGLFLGTGVSNVIMRDIYVDGHLSTGGTQKAFVFQTASSHIRLDHLFINGGKTLGSSYNNGFAFVGSSDAVVTNSTVIDVGNACFDQFSGNSDIAYIGNFCDLTGDGSGTYGVLVTGINTNLTTNTTVRAKIIGNTIKGAGQVGIWVQGGWNNVSGGGAVFGSVTDTIISNNIIDTVSAFHGIQVSEAARILVSNNVIRNTQSEGIRVNSQDAADGGTTANVTVTDNVITGCNLAANDTCLRVGGGVGATNITVSGNRTSGSYINAVQVAVSVSGAQIINNNMDTGSGARISDSGTNTRIMDLDPSIFRLNLNTPINLTPGLAFANLPTAIVGTIAYISNGATGGCADAACTTFGTNVTAGGGTLKLLIWYNGVNWTLIGK